MSRNGSSIGYYQTVSVMHPAAGPSRGSAGSTNGGSPFYPSSVLPTSRRERDGAPSLPQPGSIPRSQQHHHINSPDAAFHAAHLMPGPHTLHSNGSSSSMLQHPASEGGLNNEMTSQGSNQQAHHSNQVYHADFTDFSGPQSATPYHARELGESQTQPDLSMRHGNMQPSPRSYSQAEFGDSMGAPATPKHGALQAPSNAELARAIESLGSTLGGQISNLGSQLASLLQLTNRLVQLQQDSSSSSLASRPSASVAMDGVDRRRSGVASAADAPSWNPTWTSESPSNMGSALPDVTRPASSSTIVYTEAAAPAPPPQLGSPYAPSAAATASIQGRPVSRGFLQAFGAARLPGGQASHKEPPSDASRGSLPLPRSYFNDVVRYDGRTELNSSESISPRAAINMRAATVGPVLASSDRRSVVPRTARLNELPPAPPSARRGSEPHTSPDANLGDRGQVGASGVNASIPLVLQLMRDTEMDADLSSFEATAMGVSGSLDGAGLVPARPGSSSVRQEPTRSNSNPTLPRENAVAGASRGRASTSNIADSVDELETSRQGNTRKKEQDWKFWASESVNAPRGKVVPPDFKPKYSSMTEVRQERKSLTKRTMATIGRIPLKEYLEVGDDYLAVRRTGRKCVADWLQPFTRMAKQDPMKITACINKLEHDHPILALCEAHWKAKSILQQTLDNSLDELALKSRKADKAAGRLSATAEAGTSAADNTRDSREVSQAASNGTRRSADAAELDEAGRPNQRARLSEANSLNDAMTGVSSSASLGNGASGAASASQGKGKKSSTAARSRQT